ncbi:hypothetical protein [Streptomyces coriariae]|uniref:hypothetical protein n=1 Tax=Streptomyces coriariae TaxID=2864460 RepID=UPI001E3954A2|nr:hypothetical protein [Streptomyces coriariae]
METGHLEALAEGQCGTWLLDSLAGARLTGPLVRAAATGSRRRPLPLVTQDPDGHLVGALLSAPSGRVIFASGDRSGRSPCRASTRPGR